MVRASTESLVPRRAIAHSPWLALVLTICCGTSSTGTVNTSASGSGNGGSYGGSSTGPASGSSTGPASGASTGSASGSGSGAVDAGNLADATTGSDGGRSADGSLGGASGDASSLLSGRQALAWTPTYKSFSQSLKSVTTTTPKAFTQVSPDFYEMNSSTTPRLNGSPPFDGLSIAQVVTQVHAAGMTVIPLMYAGAGNSGGTDQYIQDVLNDSPAGTQSSLISWLVMEAKTNEYDGWNLDWEVGNTGYTAYGMKYISFLTAAKAALHAQKIILTIDIGGWYIRQCGGDGLVDLTQIGPAVDAAIIEDYAGGLGPPNPLSACPGQTPAATVNCDPGNYFGAQLNVMCDVSPASAISIGLINGQGGTGANPFLPMALDSIAAIGFTQVAVWPGENTFLTSTNIPGGATWYSLLAQFLAQ
jgi:hypothetical protein